MIMQALPYQSGQYNLPEMHNGSTSTLLRPHWFWKCESDLLSPPDFYLEIPFSKMRDNFEITISNPEISISDH